MYPALAVLQAMEGKYSEILWVGGKDGMESELINRLNLPYEEIPAAGVHGVGLRSLPGNIIKLLKGVIQSAQILKRFKPDVILYTGGYVAAPMAVAGFRIPSVLYVPDIEPGFALNFIAKFAHAIALTTESSKKYFSKSKNLVVTGYPIRNDLRTIEKSKALETFNFSDNLPVILVYGGSKGSHSINQAIIKHIHSLLSSYQIIHVTGKIDWEEISDLYDSLPIDLRNNYHIYPYLHEEMSAAFSCAELVICRSGASTLGELPFFGLPAILVPYPYAWRYQKVNAEYLVNNKAAILVVDQELDHQLLNEINRLFETPEKLTEMREAMKSLSKSDAAHQIGFLILSQVSSSNQEGGLR